MEWDTSDLRADKYQDGKTDLQLTGNLKLKGVLGSDDPQFTYSLPKEIYYPTAEAKEHTIIVTISEASLGNENYRLPEKMEFTIKGTVPQRADRSHRLHKRQFHVL